MSRSIFLTIFLAIALAFLTGCNDEKKRQESQRAWDALNQSQQKANDELDAQNAALEYELIRTEFGEDAARKWDKCLHDPPRVKKNQDMCATLLAHIKKIQDKQVQDEKIKKSKW